MQIDPCKTTQMSNNTPVRSAINQIITIYSTSMCSLRHWTPQRSITLTQLQHYMYMYVTVRRLQTHCGCTHGNSNCQADKGLLLGVFQKTLYSTVATHTRCTTVLFLAEGEEGEEMSQFSKSCITLPVMPHIMIMYSVNVYTCIYILAWYPGPFPSGN